jgi:hypothetical protein
VAGQEQNVSRSALAGNVGPGVASPVDAPLVFIVLLRISERRQHDRTFSIFERCRSVQTGADLLDDAEPPVITRTLLECRKRRFLTFSWDEGLGPSLHATIPTVASNWANLVLLSSCAASAALPSAGSIGPRHMTRPPILQMWRAPFETLVSSTRRQRRLRSIGLEASGIHAIRPGSPVPAESIDAGSRA